MKVRLYTGKSCFMTIVHNLNNGSYSISLLYLTLLTKIELFNLLISSSVLSAREIFARGGIDINIVHKKLPQRRIKEWMDNYKKFGIRYFLPEDEYYQSITYEKNNKVHYDTMKMQLMDFVLKRLKEIKLDENR